MNVAPMVLGVRGLSKGRVQGPQEIYTLSVPALDVRLGEKILITGPSGSGKSTFLDMAGLVLRPDAARAFVFNPNARASTPGARPGNAAGLDVAEAWARGRVEDLALWRRSIGYILQTGGLLPFITVLDNILAPRKLLGLPPDPLPQRLIKALGITSLVNKYPVQLSVGERQRAAIARALAANPPLVLADEPTAALDPQNARTVLELLLQSVESMGTTLILVTHAPEQVQGMGFRRLAVTQKEGGEAMLAEEQPSAQPVTVRYPGGSLS